MKQVIDRSFVKFAVFCSLCRLLCCLRCLSAHCCRLPAGNSYSSVSFAFVAVTCSAQRTNQRPVIKESLFEAPAPSDAACSQCDGTAVCCFSHASPLLQCDTAMTTITALSSAPRCFHVFCSCFSWFLRFLDHNNVRPDPQH